MSEKEPGVVSSGHIQTLKIQNFKSIKSIEFEPKRINLFIGQPNSGKSNILEAISLLDGGGIGCYGEQAIRYGDIADLFFNKKRVDLIEISSSTNISTTTVNGNYDNIAKKYQFKFSLTSLQSGDKSSWTTEYDGINSPQKIGIQHISPHRPRVLFYKFQKMLEADTQPIAEEFAYRLQPYHGRNIHHIIESNPELLDAISRIIAGTELEILFDAQFNKYELQKRIGNTSVKISFNLIADTFQRIIFHLAAIYSNSGNVLLFEEPEAHSYPPYIDLLASEICASHTNQFFIATHSKYVVARLFEDAFHDLRVFLVEYKNHETVVSVIDADWLRDKLESGSDIFFNLTNYSL